MSEAEAVGLGMWEDHEREGLPGILRWACEDAVRRPPCSRRSVLRSTAGYRNEAYIAMHRAEDVA